MKYLVFVAALIRWPVAALYKMFWDFCKLSIIDAKLGAQFLLEFV